MLVNKYAEVENINIFFRETKEQNCTEKSDMHIETEKHYLFVILIIK